MGVYVNIQGFFDEGRVAGGGEEGGHIILSDTDIEIGIESIG